MPLELNPLTLLLRKKENGHKILHFSELWWLEHSYTGCCFKISLLDVWQSIYSRWREADWAWVIAKEKFLKSKFMFERYFSLTIDLDWTVWCPAKDLLDPSNKKSSFFISWNLVQSSTIHWCCFRIIVPLYTNTSMLLRCSGNCSKQEPPGPGVQSSVEDT